jgi:hypothetical protein
MKRRTPLGRWVHSLVIGCALSWAGSAVAQSLGPQQRLTSVTGRGTGAQVAACPGGGGVAVWAELTTEWRVRFQRFDAAGLTVGSPSFASSVVSELESIPAVACGEQSFLVAWAGGAPNPPRLLFMRSFALDGTPLQEETALGFAEVRPGVVGIPGQGFLVVTAAFGSVESLRLSIAGEPSPDWVPVAPWSGALAPVFARDETGRTLMVWASSDPSDPGAIVGQLLADDGSPVGGRFRINQHTPGPQLFPSVTPRTGGGFWVAWSNDEFEEPSSSLQHVRAVDPDGGFGSDDLPLPSQGSNVPLGAPLAIVDQPPGFALVWYSAPYSTPFRGGPGPQGSTLHLRTFDALGQPLAPTLPIDDADLCGSSEPSATALPGGPIVVGWEAGPGPGPPCGGLGPVWLRPLGVPGGVVGIPTLGVAGLAGLALALGLAGAGLLRRRQSVLRTGQRA